MGGLYNRKATIFEKMMKRMSKIKFSSVVVVGHTGFETLTEIQIQTLNYDYFVHCSRLLII
jgi:hypothetical protein